MSAVLELLHPGLGVTVQDLGRRGWKRFGVPPGGAMDPHAAAWANRLVNNPDDAPVLELLLQGAVFRVLARKRFAVAGAEAGSVIPAWQARELEIGARLEFPGGSAGLWAYLAVEGGFQAEKLLGSVSAYPRGGIGRIPAAGNLLSAGDPQSAKASAFARAWVAAEERRDYARPPILKVWPAQQWEDFSTAARREFFARKWSVSSRSDRVGYRLEGGRIPPPAIELRSEPVLVGSVQVPPDGQPIVIMRDGPTVGGYPKIGILDDDSLSRLAQCRPGVPFRMKPIS